MQIKRRPLPSNLPNLSDISPILQRIYAARGIEHVQQLDKSLHALLPFASLTDINKACVRLEEALRGNQRILVVGDFDADGATSSALAVSALRLMGAKQIEFLVPNRFEFGYGLTPAIVEVAKKWRPDLMITVDNGIASIEGVQAANQARMDVLITDHHLPGETLPEACAIVNPNQSDDQFSSKSIAGVGVIFYVMLALRRHLVERGWFESQSIAEPNMAQFLDLVALGTVADVVALDQNNRILVKQGLARIRQGMARPGISALIEIAGRNPAELYESDLGYAIAPRLNAAGRLDDMSLGIECLLCEDMSQARRLAEELDALNQERRKIETEMKEQAMQALQQLAWQDGFEGKPLPVALSLVDPSWHQGVIGILAGRLKERYHRPVIAFAVVSETEFKGSARSIPGLNIRDVLAAVDKDHPGVMMKFGGHAMAAGLSIYASKFQVFQQAFIDEVSKYVEISQCEGEILSDGPLQKHELNLNLALELQQAGPWGQQFPEPIFDNVFEIIDQRVVGQRHLKLTLMATESQSHETFRAEESVACLEALSSTERTFQMPLRSVLGRTREEHVFDAIAFNVDMQQWPNHRARFIHAAYRVDINVYQGRSRLQLVILAMQVV